LIREISVIHGQKYDRIFTTDSADHTDESQRSQKGCSIPQRIHVFAVLHHAGRTNGTANLALFRENHFCITGAGKQPEVRHNGRLRLEDTARL
jgi:hypothetical protein